MISTAIGYSFLNGQCHKNSVWTSSGELGLVQGWEFALLLFALVLKITHFKEWPWAIRSLQRSLLYEWFTSDSSKLLAKTSNSLDIFFVCFWQFFLFLCPKSESFPSLFAHSLCATVSDLLTSLFKKEQKIAIRLK